MTDLKPRVGRWLIRVAITGAAQVLFLTACGFDRAQLAVLKASWRTRRYRDRRFPL